MQEKRLDRQWVVQGYAVWRTTRPFVPPTDVIEFPDRLVILVEIAGMRPTDFTITLYNARLVISGVRERPALQNAAYHQVEIGYGEFRVEVLLSWSVERDDVNASYRDGFLQIDLPRRNNEPVQVIDVKVEQDNRDE